MTFYTFPLFGCFVIFLIWFAYERKKTTRIQEKQNEDFWNRENEANFSRRKNLDVISYIAIPLDTFPIARYPENTAVSEAEQLLLSLKDKRMLNLTGKTSTDLKMEYGVANLPMLNEYDENYVALVKALQQYAEALCAAGHSDDAITVLEFAVSAGSDLKSSYMLLADIYCAGNMREKTEALIPCAEKLDSLMREPIISALKELLQTFS